MTVIGDSEVQIRPKIDGFEGEATSMLGAATDRIGGSLLGTVGKLGGIFAGIFAVDKVKDFVMEGVDSLTNMSKISAQAEAVIRSTGGAAGVSAEQILAFGESTEKATGVEKENVDAGENMLATFTNIKNGVGEGNDIFTQASKIMVDLSTAMGTDTKSAAIQLGKALNDPTQGISALQRVGVSFNDTQKQQIANFQKAGDVASAQKVVLAELNKEFGGSAAAFGESQAGQIAKMKERITDLAEEVAGFLMPTIERLTSWLVDNLPKGIDLIDKGFEKIQPVIKTVTGLFETFMNGFKTGDSAEADGLTGITGAFEDLGVEIMAIERAVTPIIKTLMGAFSGLFQGPPGSSSGGGIATAFQKIQPILSSFSTNVSKIAGDVTKFLQSPQFQAFVNMIITNVQKLVAQIQVLWPRIQTIITTVFTIISTVVHDVLNGLMAFWSRWGSQIMSVVGAVFNQIALVIRTAIRVIQDIVQIALDLLQGHWGDAFGKLWDIVKAVFSLIWGTIKNALTVIWNLVQVGLGELWRLFSDAFVSIGRAVLGGIDAVVRFFQELPLKIFGAINDLTGRMVSFGVDLMQGLADGIKNAAGRVIDTIKRYVTDALPDFVKKALGINSPSTLFHEFGQNIMQGMANGIDAGSGGPSSALKKALGGLTGSPGALTAGLAVAGTTGSNSTIQLDVNINAPGANSDTVSALRQVARDELGKAFTKIVRGTTAGSGTGR